MVDGVDVDRGASVAGSRGYFIKVSMYTLIRALPGEHFHIKHFVILVGREVCYNKLECIFVDPHARMQMLLNKNL